MADAKLTAMVGQRTSKGTLVTQAMQDAANADAAGIVIVLQDNAAAIEKALSKAMIAALEETGLLAEGYAKKKCPVDTGRLRNSITHELSAGENAVYIGTNVEYARAVEMGTRHQKAQPYLRPAANDHGSTYRAVFEKHLGR